ncbi:MAG: formate dehydrogenase accessory sulfurtransferase FdhD [Bacillota bacterium]
MDMINKMKIRRLHEGYLDIVDDDIAVEYPFTIFLNGEEFVTLLCSPQALDYLTVGFLLSEGLIRQKDDIVSLTLHEDKGRMEVVIKNDDGLARKLLGTRTVTTGCGKGTAFYNVLDSFQSRKITADAEFQVFDLIKRLKEFNRKSQVFLKTGGVHSAGLSDGKELVIFHEDVGRHNAIDKVIGEAEIKGISLVDKIVITSGRISSEMLIKIGKRGIPVILSRSAPTDLAVKIAKEIGVTIIGFARGERMNIYTESRRIQI